MGGALQATQGLADAVVDLLATGPMLPPLPRAPAALHCHPPPPAPHSQDLHLSPQR